MDERTIYITAFDLERLRKLLNEARQAAPRGNVYLASLDEEISRGRIVTPSEVPADVITMNSKVRLVDLDTHEEVVYTLVFPDDADLDEGKISVLAPIGTAILGLRVGAVFTWQVPDGTRRMQVKELLYQPEASGDYHL